MQAQCNPKTNLLIMNEAWKDHLWKPITFATFYLFLHSLKPGLRIPSPSFAPSLILSLYALGSRRKDSSVENALLYRKKKENRKLVVLFLLSFWILPMFLRFHKGRKLHEVRVSKAEVDLLLEACQKQKWDAESCWKSWPRRVGLQL